MENCLFTRNFAEFRGGGLLNLPDSTDPLNIIPGDITMTNVDFVSNRVNDNGGGFYNGASKTHATNCNFVGNFSAVSGGGACNRGTVGGQDTWDNCKFIGNLANDSGTSPVKGGGGMFNASSSPSVTNCEFYRNTAPTGGGGGMWNEKDADQTGAIPSSPEVTNCTFIENEGKGGTSLGGGGMWNEGESCANITGCQFRGNIASDYGGGIFNTDSGTIPIIKDCVFVRNSVNASGGSGSGGGMINEGASGAKVVNSIFVDNDGGNFGGSGAANETSLNAEFHGCVFVGNISSGPGGGVFDAAVGTKLFNCAFVGNQSEGSGGAISTFGDVDLSVTNCTISANSATGFGVGGGVFKDIIAGTLSVTNSIIWGNTDDVSSTEEAQIFGASTGDVTFSDWEGHRDDPARGNIDDDPKFAAAATSGAWTADGMYKGDIHQTVFTDTNQSWSVDQFKDFLINPNTTQMRQSIIVSNTVNTITVWGDFRLGGVNGKAYSVREYRVGNTSPVIDAGDDAATDYPCVDDDDCLNVGSATCNGGVCMPPPPDLGGSPRIHNAGNECVDTDFVDMGAYELQSGANSGCRMDNNRYLTIRGDEFASGTKKIKVTLMSLDGFSSFNGQTRWVGVPADYPEGGNPTPTFKAAPLVCLRINGEGRDWSTMGVFYVFGPEIVPNSIYEIEAFVGPTGDGKRTVKTVTWGDVVTPYESASLPQPNFEDVSAVIDKFKGTAGAPIKARAQLQPNIPNPSLTISFMDISDVTDAFLGIPYPYNGPCTCPYSTCP